MGYVMSLYLAVAMEYEYSDSDDSSSSSSDERNSARTTLYPKTTDLGKRVVFSGNDKKQKYGVLRFVGETEFSEGVWCGVELDQPTGKNNGSIHGIRYFTCEPNCGVFVPCSKLELDTSRRSRSRPNSQPSSRASSVERKEPQSRPITAKMSSKVSGPSVNKLSIQQDLVNRLAQPLRRSSQPTNPTNRRQPMKAFATKGIGKGDKVKEEKKLAPFRSGGMYKASSTENIRAMKDKDKTGQKLSHGMPAKKSSSERDLRKAGKTNSAPAAKTDIAPLNKGKWKQMRTSSCSDILDPLPNSETTSTKTSTTSSTSHTSLEGYPWPRTSTPGNRDELTPDGCSSPEEAETHVTKHMESSSISNNAFLMPPQDDQVTPIATKDTPIATAQAVATEVVECDSDDVLASHVKRFTAQVATPLTHASVPPPDTGPQHKYRNRPSGTATLEHPLTSTLTTDSANLLNKLLGPNKSVSSFCGMVSVQCLELLTLALFSPAGGRVCRGCGTLVPAARGTLEGSGW